MKLELLPHQRQGSAVVTEASTWVTKDADSNQCLNYKKEGVEAIPSENSKRNNDYTGAGCTF